MTRPIRRKSDYGEVPVETRVQQAVNEYQKRLHTKEEISIRKAAKMYGITSWERVRRHIHGASTRAIHSVSMQRLSPLEEEVLVVWAKQLYGWGWPARVAHLRTMAIELLAEKGDKEKLGDNWHLKFFGRYPDLKSKFAIPRDRKRYDA
jgi:hypothetical protein